MDFTPFKIAIPDEAIEDLRIRLDGTRWPHSTSTDWSRGQPVPFIRELADQWARSFDWRKAEARINAYPQFTTEIDGQHIHFLHVKSKAANSIPLLLLHGWPSSIYEFIDVIGPLTDPATHGLDPAVSFDLVIPSLPGYGFSTPLATTGWDSARMAKAFAALMSGLGYERYGAQGGDAGGLVVRELGILAPKGLIGVHLQQVFAFPNGTPGEMEKLSKFEMEGFANLDAFQRYNGYQYIQQKRPGTLGYGLVDSPVAQLAWNTELFFGFDGSGVHYADREKYLVHASIYWFTASGGSAANHYFEDAQTGAGYREDRNATPTGVSVFPWDFRSVRSFVERSTNVVYWREMPEGGHFAAADTPALFAEEMRTFFAQVR
jgi:pimeloyl-ACP methyl ester carboxylesterase